MPNHIRQGNGCYHIREAKPQYTSEEDKVNQTTDYIIIDLINVSNTILHSINRSEMTNKPSLMPATNAAPMSSGPNGVPMPSAAMAGTGSGPKLENSTMRITSKTKVSTGSRRNNISE